MVRILVVEDDQALRDGIRELLQEAGYSVCIAESYRAAVGIRDADRTEGRQFDLYLLDIMLENGSGYTLCEEIRQEEDTPVIFLSALDDEDHIIHGLNLGADDYIVKPFHRRELLARVAAHIRRGNLGTLRGKDRQRPIAEHRDGDGDGAMPSARTASSEELSVVRSGDITFRRKEERFYIRGEEVSFRRLEAELLKYFIQSNGRLLRREHILEYIWDKDGIFVEDNTLSVHISRLRKRIGKYRGEEYIETLRGIGYRWNQEIGREEEVG